MIDPDGTTWYFFGVKAVCPQCRDECWVFDNQLCGWDRVVADREAEPRSGPRTWPWRCLDCGSATHHGTVAYGRDETADFLERVRGRVPPDEWSDAYHWFSMALRGCGCGRETSPWVSYECR
jgi:hypothetical protein